MPFKGLRFAAAALAMAATAQTAQAADLVVFAAASLKTALDEVAAAYAAQGGAAVAASYAASSALAKQIEQGAPADLFLSADVDWMDHLAERNLIRAETRAEFLSNRLVIAGPASGAETADIERGLDLAVLLGSDGRLAVGDTKAVPAGRYAREALESLGLWEQVSGRLAEGENVRAALALVSRGEAPLGIVYRTDVEADPGVRIVGTFPQDSHRPILYPAAVTASATHPEAQAFRDFLLSETADAVFEAQGFILVD